MVTRKTVPTYLKLSHTIGMADKSYSKFNLFIRSLLVSIFLAVTMILYCTVVYLFLLPFSIKKRYQTVSIYSRIYARVLKLLCHLDYEVQGLENIPKDRATIIMSKHQSVWETLVFPGIFKNLAVIIKRELLRIPFFGWMLARLNLIAIDRSQKASAMQQIIEQGTKCLNEGRSILIFPEGTRTAYGTVGQYKLGGPRLAVATGHPIIPVAHNAGKFWPKGRFLKYPGTIKVVIGPLIEPNRHTAEELLELTKTWIEETMVKIG